MSNLERAAEAELKRAGYFPPTIAATEAILFRTSSNATGSSCSQKGNTLNQDILVWTLI